jgi:hypothetical protein
VTSKIAPRTYTPNRDNDDGSTTITMKRCCNGCGVKLGDLEDRDVDDHGNLTDVRGECEHCRPLVEAEAAGCTLWQLTPRSYGDIDRRLDKLGVFAKQYTKMVDGHVTTVGMRIGVKPGHVVACFGDTIIRHPDGGFTVHPGPAAVETGE